jgi:hypothetical protein
MSNVLDELVKAKVKIAITQSSVSDRDIKLKQLTGEVGRLNELLGRITADNTTLQRNFGLLLKEKNALRHQLEGEPRSETFETDSVEEETKSASSSGGSLQWEEVLGAFEKYRRSHKLRRLIIEGVPQEHREELWLRAIGNPLSISAGLYSTLHSRTRERPQENVAKPDDTHLIPLDLMRTLNTLQLRYEESLLSDVLNIFAQYRPDVGYVQGMAYLNGIMLIHLSPVKTFQLFANLVISWELLFRFYTFDVPAIHANYDIFTKLLKKKLPRVLRKFQELEITPDMFFLEWVYTLFARCFSQKTVSQLWDWLFVEGSQAVFRVAIAILQGLEHDIVRGELDDIMVILNSTQQRFPDFESLWRVLKKVNVRVS